MIYKQYFSRPNKRTRSGDAFTPSEGTGRVTTREMWKLIDTLKDIIHHQTILIESTQNELQEVKHNQNVLQDQNEKFYEEVQALRTQLQALPTAPPSRS